MNARFFVILVLLLASHHPAWGWMKCTWHPVFGKPVLVAYSCSWVEEWGKTTPKLFEQETLIG